MQKISEVLAVGALIRFFSRIKIQYTRSSPLLKCAVLAAIVLSTVALITLRAAHQQEQARLEALRAEAAALEQDNHKLQENISQLGTLEGIRRIAIEELGLADPNTVIFVSED